MFLRKIGRGQVNVNLEDWSDFVGPVVEGSILADYRFEDFKTKKTTGIVSLRILVHSEDVAAAKRAAERSIKIGEATNLVRQIGNQPGNLLYPDRGSPDRSFPCGSRSFL